MKLPPALKKHDSVVILSPAGRIEGKYVFQAAELFKEWGLVPLLSKHALGSFGRYSGTTQERLFDLQQAMDDPSIKLILCSRGGYGVVHLLPHLDYSSIKNNPKWIVGYSDITALHASLQLHGVASLHAPMAKHLSEEDNDRSIALMRDILFGNSLHYRLSVGEHQELNRLGTVRGRVFGGNLSVFTSLLGTRFVNIPKGGILFLEDIGEEPYKVDRMIRQLSLAGVFDRIGGLIVGQFTGFEEDKLMSKPLLQSIQDVVKIYTFPLCFDFPVGHVKDNYPLVMGIQAEFSVKKSSVSLSQIVHHKI